MSQHQRQPVDENRVIDAAAELADREGLDALTLTRVAKELGVRQPALYRHVESYNDLLRSLSLRGRELLAEAIS
ncbi:MAG: TetR family transcriptional regulator [Ilumatobacteraceae bacterium]